MVFRRVGCHIGQQHDAAIPAYLVEPVFPAIGGPVFGPAVNEQGERAFVHQIFAPYLRISRATLAAHDARAKCFRLLSAPGILVRPWIERRCPRMLYAILCYHDEDFTGSWTKEQDAAVMQKLAVVQDKLTKQGRLGPVARLLPTTSATTLRKDDPPLVLDGPFAETKEQLLGSSIADCKTLHQPSPSA